MDSILILTVFFVVVIMMMIVVVVVIMVYRDWCYGTGVINKLKKNKEGEKEIFVRTTVSTYLLVWYFRIIISLFKLRSYT